MLNFIKIINFNKKGIFLVFFLWMIGGMWSSVYAVDPCTDPYADGCGGDPDLPLDNEVWILIAAGALYGLKKIRDHKRELQNLQSAE